MPKRRLLGEGEEDRGSNRAERVIAGVAKAGEGEKLPQKKFFRQRAHINPLSTSSFYQYPISPERMPWSTHYPNIDPCAIGLASHHRFVADVGCGFGGLTVALAPLLPHSLVLGMEIRPKVTEYIRLRILALRRQQAQAQAQAQAQGQGQGGVAALDGQYTNASVCKINAMKYLPCFFGKGQLDKLFFCFPDPHFKPGNHRRRIVGSDLLAEYAYVLAPGSGRLYTITDVQDLHNWMAGHGDAHPAFVRLTAAELDADPCVTVMREATEEGKKVTRQGGDNGKGEKYVAVFRRVSDEEACAREAARGDFWSEPPVAYEWTPAPAQAHYLATYGTGEGSSKSSLPAAGPVIKVAGTSAAQAWSATRIKAADDK